MSQILSNSTKAENKSLLQPTRRQFLLGAGALTAPLLIPRFGFATEKLDQSLRLHNIHTGETFQENVVENGQMVPEALVLINKFMRDHRNGKTCNIDPNLIKMLGRLQKECTKPGLTCFDVVSGYRSPETNNMLRKRSKGVAKNSFHMKGCAVDIKLPGHLRELRNLAKSYQKGGVGYYPKSGFVHVDTRGYPAYWGAA